MVRAKDVLCELRLGSTGDGIEGFLKGLEVAVHQRFVAADLWVGNSDRQQSISRA
jgi:hypothetical protein